MSKIVSIHSFRGGTGKSNITANLAAWVASNGHRVGIVDTDIQSPGIHVLFGFDAQRWGYSLNDYLWGKCPIEDTAYDVSNILQTTAQSNRKMYLIPSSIKTGDIAKILHEGFDFYLLQNGFQALIETLNLDYLFIDTHPGLNEETLLSLTLSDILAVILRPDRQDFQGTALTVEIARKLEVPDMFLIFTKVLPNLDLNDLKQEAEKNYRISVAEILLYAEEILELASNDIFCIHHPNHAFSTGIANIAKRILSYKNNP